MVLFFMAIAFFYLSRQCLVPIRETQQAFGGLMVGRGLSHRTIFAGTRTQILRPVGTGSFGRDHTAHTIIDYCQQIIVTRPC